MAVVNSNEYDHIDVVAGSNTNRHFLKDATARQGIQDLQTHLNNLSQAKINKPHNNPNGVSGQILMTNGDGSTSWTNSASPTDEQVVDAVTAWLNNHPEATTTVQDLAVTFPKLGNDVRSQINLKQSVLYYGADNSGATYSDDAIEDAIEANLGGQIYFPSGEYLISKPIKTYDAVTKAVSIIFEPDAVIKTDTVLECLLDIGGLDSEEQNRYPLETYNRLIIGGVFDAENCTYPILVEDRAIQYIIKDITCIGCTNGIKVARTSALSQDVIIKDSYIVGKGSEYSGTGLIIYGNDNAIENVKIYAFQKAMYINGGGFYAYNSHTLAIYKNGTSVSGFGAIYKNTLGIECRGKSKFINLFVDGYYKFAEILAASEFRDCTFYNYDSLSGHDVEVFKIYTMLGYISIVDCNITIIEPENASSVIVLDESFDDQPGRFFRRLSNGLMLRNNHVVGQQYLRTGDLIMASDDKVVVPYVNPSNSRQITLNTWYIMGYIVVPDTQQNRVEIVIGGDVITCVFYVLNGTQYIIRAVKEVDNLARYNMSFERVETANNYDVYAVCVQQTAGGTKSVNGFVNLLGDGYAVNYNTVTSTNYFIEMSSPPSKITTVANPREFKSASKSITASAGEVVKNSITFSSPFTGTPYVTAIPRTGFPQNCRVAVNNVTSSGFDLYVYADKALSGLSVAWSAWL